MRSVRSIRVVYYVLMGLESVHLRLYIWADVPLHMHVWPFKCDMARHMYKLLSVAHLNLRSSKLHIHQGVLPTQQLLIGISLIKHHLALACLLDKRTRELHHADSSHPMQMPSIVGSCRR